MNESALNAETRLPRQVRARAARAAELLNPTPTPADQPPQPTEAPAPSAVVEPQAPTPTPAPVAAGDPRETDFRYWKQRFQVTEGMWKRDKAKWDAERQQLLASEEALQARVRELELKGSTTDDVDLAEFFSAEEIEQLGEDQARIHARAIRAQAKRIATELVEKEVAPLRKRSQDDAQREADQARLEFFAALDSLAPNWREVNKDQRWIDWLSQDDPTSGLWRQDLVDQYQARGDAARLAGLIKQWEREAGAVSTPGTPPVLPASSAGHGSTPAPAGPPVTQGPPSNAEIRDFYKRKAIGRIKPDEVAAFEARLKAHGFA